MIETDTNVRNWAMFCHLAVFAGYLTGGLGWLLGPLIVWLIKRNDSLFINEHGKEAVNFQISMHLYALLAGVVALVTCGVGLLIAIPMWVALAIVDIICPILGAIQASNGMYYRYPLSIRFIS